MSNFLSYPRPAAAQAKRAGDVWVIVPNDDGGEVVVVNHTGHRVWELCNGERSLAEVATLIALNTGVDAADIDRDIARFAEGLRQAGLLIY
ncbi:PqqD family protein [Nocardia sp. NPDC052566]|uniref:PqqD family protein n=1 Tax=Nocardia sp. NPDC052566 TaxID=3364330 RepID=UPI0037C56BE7